MKSFSLTLKDVERDLVVNMALSLRHKKMDMKEARALAKGFMREKLEDYDNLFATLCTLSNSYRVARKVYVKYAPAYFEEKDRQALEEVRKKYGE